MDRITQSLLKDFSQSWEISNLTEEDRFERFAAYCVIRKHFARTFYIEEVVTGGSDDTGIDAVAIIINNVLVTELDTLIELENQVGKFDVTFVFVQVSRSSSFDAAKITNLASGVRDLFDSEPKLRRNSKISVCAETVDAILERSSLMRERPNCRLYYVTTGKWSDDQNILGCVNQVESDMKQAGVFKEVRLQSLGADELHKAFNTTKNSIETSFEFNFRTEVLRTDEVAQAYISFVPASEFLKLISEEDEILPSILYDNVCDWLAYNVFNTEIRDTLISGDRDKFAFIKN